MDQDRRSFLSKAPLAVAGAAISANEIGQRVGGVTTGSTPRGGWNIAERNPSPDCPDNPPAPNMPREAAFKMLSQNASVRREVHSRLVQDAKYAITPANIDPDIAILRSISPMAKLTLARQRYIERGLESTFQIDGGFGSGWLRDFIGNKVHDLMWSPKTLLSDYLKS